MPRELRNLVIPDREWNVPPQHGQGKEASAAAASSAGAAPPSLPPLDVSAARSSGQAAGAEERGVTPLVDEDEMAGAGHPAAAADATGNGQRPA